MKQPTDKSLSVQGHKHSILLKERPLDSTQAVIFSYICTILPQSIFKFIVCCFLPRDMREVQPHSYRWDYSGTLSVIFRMFLMNRNNHNIKLKYMTIRFNNTNDNNNVDKKQNVK